jgi:hypothetical protein
MVDFEIEFLVSLTNVHSTYSISYLLGLMLTQIYKYHNLGSVIIISFQKMNSFFSF